MTARQHRNGPEPARPARRGRRSRALGGLLGRDAGRRIAVAVMAVLVCPLLIAGIQAVWRLYYDQRELKCASGRPGGDFYAFALDLTGILGVEASERAIPMLSIPETTLSVDPCPTDGTMENLLALRSGKAKLGFAQEGFDALGSAGQSGSARAVRPAGRVEEPALARDFPGDGTSPEKPSEPRDIQTLAVVGRSVLHVVARRSLHLSTVSGLQRWRGRRLRVYIGAGRSGTRALTLAVLRQHGLPAPDSNRLAPADKQKGFDDAVSDLECDQIDVAFFLSSYGAPALDRLDREQGSRFCFLDVDRASGVQAAYPALEQVTIPAGTYSSLQPASPKTGAATLAARSVLVCSKELSRRDAYTIVQALFEDPTIGLSASAIAAQHDLPRPADRTYFPIHPGARAYFRGDNKPAPVDPELLHVAYSGLLMLPAPFLYLLGWRRVSELVEAMNNLEEQMESLRGNGRGKHHADVTAAAESKSDAKHSHPEDESGCKGGAAPQRAGHSVVESAAIARLRRSVDEVEFQAARLYWQRKIKSDVFGALSAYANCCRREIAETATENGTGAPGGPGNGTHLAR